MSLEMAHVGESYERKGYVALREAAPPEVARGLLGLICKRLAEPGAAQRLLSAPSVNEKPAIEFHSMQYTLALGFHWGLTPRIADITGRRLAPSYGFFRAYQKGDVCLVHSDRPACEHSMSLALGYSDEIIWDFEVGSQHFEYDEACKLKFASDFGDERFEQVKLAPGDAIVYRGVNRRHGRIAPNPNRWSAHLFLHWVDLDGPYAEWAFDKRPPPAPKDIVPNPLDIHSSRHESPRPLQHGKR